MTVPLSSLTATWNAAGTVFSAIKMNVTDTGHAAGSRLLDLQIGGVSQANIGPNGLLSVFTNAGVGILTASGYSGIGEWFGRGALFDSGNLIATFQTSQWNFGTGTSLSWNTDASINWDAANTLGQRHGVAAQTYRVYNTFTDASNYERGALDWIATTNTFRIRSENLGTGTNRIIAIDGFAKAGAAVAADIPTSTWALVHDTSGSTTKLIYNDAGTLRTVSLV